MEEALSLGNGCQTKVISAHLCYLPMCHLYLKNVEMNANIQTYISSISAKQFVLFSILFVNFLTAIFTTVVC